MSSQLDPYIVLVTGGSGFLGQHIVGLLQTKTDYVTEIRVVDVVAYVNKLDYAAPKPVRQYVGSITDLDLLLEACQGVHCVMHIASIVDVSMFPEDSFSYKVNVTGMYYTLIKACRQRGVASLIYCSTVDVVIGHDNIYNGTEVSTNKPSKNFFQTYGPTKTQAEEMVLNANDSNLKTLAIRPVVMYGELSQHYMSETAKTALKFGTYFRSNCGKAVIDHGYVGNIAWSFICADRALQKNDSKTSEVAGQAFFIGDESPKKNIFDFFEPMFKECGYKPVPVLIPAWMVLFPLYLLYFILLLVSFVKRVNFSVGLPAVLFLSKTYTFSYEKAQKDLQYTPIYPYEEAQRRSVKFLEDIFTKGARKDQ